MEEKQLYQTTLALAGIVQAVSLVKDLAQSGRCDSFAFETSIRSIFITEPKEMIEIYGSEANLKAGLTALLNLFTREPHHGKMLLRYVMSLIHLEKKIRYATPLQEKLKKRIVQIKKQAEYFNDLNPTVIANLADIYLRTIGVFRFRIIVWGNPRLLNSHEVMEKIRALLLAGIRSAVLWRQLGGSRLHLIFHRNQIIRMAKKILTDLPLYPEREFAENIAAKEEEENV